MNLMIIILAVEVTFLVITSLYLDYLLNQITILQLSNILHHQSFQYQPCCFNQEHAIANNCINCISPNVHQAFQLISKAPDDPAIILNMPRSWGAYNKERRLSHKTFIVPRPLPPLSNFCFLFFAVVTTCNLLL